MKSGNSRLQRLNAGLQMLSQLTLQRIQASREAKRLRQEKSTKRRAGYWAPGQGPRECARRRQQMAYDAGLAATRHVPR